MKTQLWFSILLGSGWLGACSDQDSFTVPGKAPQPKDPIVSTPAPQPTTPTIPVTTPTVPVDPCVDLPVHPLSGQQVEGPDPSEEFAFDAQGNVLNIPDGDSAVFRTPLGGPSEVVGPFDAVEVAGVRVLPDGDLVVANEWNGSIERVDLSTGARSVIAAGLNSPNSVTVDPDGMIYVANYGEVVRVDPETGEVVELAHPAYADLDGLTFSPDYGTLYFNLDEDGVIGKITLNSDGTFGTPGVHATVNSGSWSELDGMTTDACGNLFVAQVDGSILRVDVTGQVDEFADSSGWITAVNFGSGVGGWERDHLYVMDRGQGMFDLDVGVEGRPEAYLGQ